MKCCASYEEEQVIRNTILMVTIVVILAACGQSAPAAPTGAPAASASASGKISFMVFGDPAEKAAYETLVAEFKKRNAAIEVELVHIPDQADYRRRLAADIAAGTPADVVLINYRRLGAFAAKSLIEPLGPYLAQSTLVKEDDYYAEALTAFRWQGMLMCIPQNVSSLVVYYNKQLFDQAGIAYPKAGWTWDDFVKTAQALTRDTNGDGTIDQYGLGSEIEAIRLAPFIWQNGGDLVDNAEAPKRLALDTPEATAAFQWFVDLQVKHHVVPDAAAAKSENSDSRFLNGRLGMLLNSRRVVPTLREISGFDWDVAPLPQGKQSMTVLHADAYCLPKASKNKTAAWAFIEFANAAEGQAIVAKTGRTVPSLKAVALSPAFLDPNAKPQHSQVFLDVVPQARALPILDTWVDIEETITAELQRALYGEASVAEVIKAAESNTATYFSR
jgi:multiple sugar transport system substrate-binding protein